MGSLPDVPCTAFKPDKLFYFGRGINVVIILSWISGGRCLDGVLNILC